MTRMVVVGSGGCDILSLWVDLGVGSGSILGVSRKSALTTEYTEYTDG